MQRRPICKGELSNYYYSIERPIVIMLGYLGAAFSRNKVGIIIVVVSLLLYGYSNAVQFFETKSGDLPKVREEVLEAIRVSK